MNKEIDVFKSVVYDNLISKFDGLELGQIGYFSNDPSFEDYEVDQLTDIITANTHRYGTNTNVGYRYFIPKDKAVFIEQKKLIPITGMEQLIKEGLGIGDSFFIRPKGEKEVARLVTVTEITLNSKGFVGCIGLGINLFSPDELSNTYEWCKYPQTGEWKPFGIEEIKWINR